MKTSFYWYPKCSTCKDAKKKLMSLSIPVELIDIKETPPSAETLRHWQQTFQIEMKKLFNTSGNVYREMNLKDTFDSLSEDELFALLASNGMLIKRPILVNEQKIVIGFKEEAYEAFKS